MDLLEARWSAGIRHPWEQARARALGRALRAQGLAAGPPLAVLDVGCGDAYTARQALTLADCPVERLVGVDEALTQVEVEALRERHPGLRLELDWAAVAGERFDLLLLLDVVEHVREDRDFLARLVGEHLIEGGAALITVPAWDALFSAHDRFLGHFRRYDAQTLAALARSTGLAVQAQGYFFASLLLPRAASLAWERLRGPKDQRGLGGWRGGRLLTGLLTTALDADNRLLQGLERHGIRVPGLSTWAFCRAGVESPGEA